MGAALKFMKHRRFNGTAQVKFLFNKVKKYDNDKIR